MSPSVPSANSKTLRGSADAFPLHRNGLADSYACGVDIAPGLLGEASMLVGDRDTAVALGSGDVDVLGTPRVVALCEAATVAALAGRLDEGRTTVGTRVELDHLRASKVGDRIDATATLTAVDGNRLTFEVAASDGEHVVARGIVVRAVIDRARFSKS